MNHSHINTPEPWTHRIYAKHKDSKRFCPINGKGNFVINLIYAACFNEQDAISTCRMLQLDNPNFYFEIRKI